LFFRRKKYGFSLVEIMVSFFIFSIFSAAIFRAFAPTATDSHNLLRGYSFAMNLANKQISKIEAEIERYGHPDSIAENEFVDITSKVEADNAVMELLRNLEVNCRATPGIDIDPQYERLYKIEITVDWGNSENDGRPHHFQLARWKVRPSS
jgi:prepilin-type N-terminal cleavage/methylation domain-containing protein